MTKPRLFIALVFACVASASLMPPASASRRAHAPSCAQASASGPAPPVGQTGTETRTLAFTVTDDRGNFLRGLGREHFTVFDGGSRREVVSFSNTDAPASVGILLDTSGSMFSREVRRPDRATRLRFLRDALSLFLSQGNPSNEYFLIAFNQSPQMFVEPTTDRAAVLSAFDRIASADLKGQTAFYDALYVALDKAAHGRYQRRVVVAVTDGLDNTSHYSFPEVRRALAESDVTLYALAVLAEEDTPLAHAGYGILDDLTKLSGGAVLFPHDWKGFGDAAGYFAKELHDRYTISFVPSHEAGRDGWHGVKVKLDEVQDEHGRKIKTVLRARGGFYDPARH